MLKYGKSKGVGCTEKHPKPDPKNDPKKLTFSPRRWPVTRVAKRAPHNTIIHAILGFGFRVTVRVTVRGWGYGVGFGVRVRVSRSSALDLGAQTGVWVFL